MNVNRKQKQVKRISVRLPMDLYYDVRDQAARDDTTMNSLVQLACQHYLDWAHHDYDIPSLDRRRINQLVDGQKALQDTVTQKMDAMSRMLTVLLTFTHGQNYYDDDDGKGDQHGQ